MPTAELAPPIKSAESQTKSQPEIRRRTTTVVKLLLLTALLSLHGATRWHRTATMPLADRHNYERAYIYSLSLLGGRGFHDIAVPDTAAAAPVARFLDRQADSLTADEFAEFLQQSRPDDVNAAVDDHTRWVSSRILDQYVVAGLWRLFGIRWNALFGLCVAMSTLTCLLVFLIGRRLMNSDWAGLAAALMFFGSPLESQLQAWSLRDISPLWFEAFGCLALLCILDRTRLNSNWQVCLGALVLSLSTMIGVGWRPDVFISWFYLGICLLVLFKYRGIRWTRLLAAAAVYCAAGWICTVAVRSLSAEPTVDSENGFHMAVYADFSRANLLKIENSFQIERCDRETLFLARQRELATNPDGPPLPYIGKRYSHVCRDMFFDEAKYNAFRFASRFPKVYWSALSGLKVPDAFATLSTEQLREGRPPWLSRLYTTIFNPLDGVTPLLFLLGLFAATALGPRPLESALLAGITILQTVALLLVLPEQKHLGTLQLPLSIFAGIGLVTIAGILRFDWRRRGAELLNWRPPIAWTGAVIAGVAIWGATCLAAYFVSRHERTALIDAIETRAQHGLAAPETLHGDKVFSVRLLPGSDADQTGYLLRISAGDDPGQLLCRHIHFPQDWCWPRVLETTHRLAPGKEQYFFVSCLQGAICGDPRPYSCSVFLNGDARIVSCIRVDLKDWPGLQVSTVFFDGQKSPGSPSAPEGNSVMRWPDWPVIRANYDRQSLDRVTKDSQYIGPQKIPPPSSPLQHVVARDRDSGVWEIAASDGRKFTISPLNFWAPQGLASLVSGDFSGGGLMDLVGRQSDGSWWIGRANGNNIAFKSCQIDLPAGELDFAGVGDFNGDGIDDLVVRAAADGQWWIGLSDGIRFRFHRAGQCAAGVPAENVRIADFNGDGRADIAGFNPATGQLTVALSDGAQLVSRLWGKWDPSVTWRHILAADFTGSGRTDVAAWNPTTGQWQLARSNGRQFDSQPAGAWPTDADWRHVQTGRFSGDRRRGIVGLDGKSHRLAIAEFDGQQFTTRLLPAHPALEDAIYVGSFTGGNRDDLVGLSKDHEIWVGLFDHDSIRFENRGVWPAAQRLTDFRVLSFWR